MNQANTELANEVICDCSGTTRGKLQSLMEQGVNTLDGLSSKTGALTGCGACEWNLQQLLIELKTSL